MATAVATAASPSGNAAPARPLRLWPGLALLAVVLFAYFVLPRIDSSQGGTGILVGMAGAFLIVLWWLFLSRAPWAERLGVLAFLALALWSTARFLVHPSIAGGAMGMLPYIYPLPYICLALVGAAWLGRRRSPGTRRAYFAAAILLVCLGTSLIRTGGLSAGAGMDIHWRWTPTPEELLLRSGEAEGHGAAGAYALASGGSEWPGFRGPLRNGAAAAPAIATDWSARPPALLWKHPVGPGWSSFAVRGDLIYTQEQRGEEEVVACYDAKTGEPVWKHRDAARFWESNGGAGPRGTPTLDGDRVYSFGGTGIVNALDAATGAVAWTRNAATDAEAKTPTWGFASSPLVFGDLVLVAASGRLVAYDKADGELRWRGPAGGSSYSSPHQVIIDGVPQIVLLSKEGVKGISPADGSQLWEHAWPGYPIVQPGLTPDGDLLISMTDSSGLRRLAVKKEGAGWKAEERWTSMGLKPYFSDFVVHRGHAFGFDGSILSCIDLADGKRQWKGGRYGQGQLVLLPEQDLLLVVSETGEIALVEAKTEKYTELARLPAIEGKTWNHPVVVGDVLLVRNDQEMAAFRLAPKAG